MSTKISVIRFSESKAYNGSTFDALYLDGQFECYTLEDEGREVKVYGETRIPEGTYRISLASWGVLHDRYAKRWPADHIGMLMLNDVPRFEGILIHCGVNERDTAGCLIVGDTVNNNQYMPATLSGSWDAYLRLYRKIAPKIRDGETVVIEVLSLNQFWNYRQDYLADKINNGGAL